VKLREVEDLIGQMTQEIAVRQDMLTVLHRMKGELKAESRKQKAKGGASAAGAATAGVNCTDQKAPAAAGKAVLCTCGHHFNSHRAGGLACRVSKCYCGMFKEECPDVRKNTTDKT